MDPIVVIARVSAARRCAAGAIDAELIDAKAIGLPILDRMYKEFASGVAFALRT